MKTSTAFLYSWIKHKNSWLITFDVASSAFLDTISSQKFILEFIKGCFEDVELEMDYNSSKFILTEFIDFLKSFIKKQLNFYDVSPLPLFQLLFKSTFPKSTANKGNISGTTKLKTALEGKFESLVKEISLFPSITSGAPSSKLKKDKSINIPSEVVYLGTPKLSATKSFKRELTLTNYCKKSSIDDSVQIILLYQTLFTIYTLGKLSKLGENKGEQVLFYMIKPRLSKSAFNIMNEVLQIVDFTSVEDIEMIFDNEYMNTSTCASFRDEPSPTFMLKQRLTKPNSMKRKVNRRYNDDSTILYNNDISLNCPTCPELKSQISELKQKLQLSLENLNLFCEKSKLSESRVMEIEAEKKAISEKMEEYQVKYLRRFSINIKKVFQAKKETKDKLKLLLNELEQSSREIEKLRKINSDLSFKLLDAEHKEDELKLELHSQLASIQQLLNRNLNVTPKSTKLFCSKLNLKERKQISNKFQLDKLDNEGLNCGKVTETSIEFFDLQERNEEFDEMSQHIPLNEVWSHNSDNQGEQINLQFDSQSFQYLANTTIFRHQDTKWKELITFLIICLLTLSIFYCLK